METFMFILFRLLYFAGFVFIVIAHHVGFEMPELAIEDATNLAFLFIFLGIVYLFVVRIIEMRYEDHLTETDTNK